MCNLIGRLLCYGSIGLLKRLLEAERKFMLEWNERAIQRKMEDIVPVWKVEPRKGDVPQTRVFVAAFSYELFV